MQYRKLKSRISVHQGALAALVLVALVAGCGGSSGDKKPNARQVNAEARKQCLEEQEVGAPRNLPPSLRRFHDEFCEEVGVTATTPPPSSGEAQAAARAAHKEQSHQAAELNAELAEGTVENMLAESEAKARGVLRLCQSNPELVYKSLGGPQQGRLVCAKLEKALAG
jgi:hypothetical protein